MLFTLFLIGALGAYWYLLRDTEPPEPPPRRNRRKSRYRAVRIIPAGESCPAARAASQHRLLLTAAPRLPLEHCDRILRCRCRFRHFADRRSGDERRQMFGALTVDTLKGPVNRRSGIDRRRQPPLRLDEVH
jgi:hypothetical protein